MKSIINFSLSILLLFLLTVSLASAHGEDDGMGSDQMDSNNMMNMNPGGFEGYSDHMKIEGQIQVTDSVKLTISAEPTEEMNEMMNDHMGSSSNMMAYSNMMTISLTKLVEFEDITNNGYSEDDALISEFVLNQSTMYEAEMQSDSSKSIFVIYSKSNVINITVEMLSDNDSPYAFKWSLDINYPFIKNNTKVAILHEMDSLNMGDMMATQDQTNNQGFDSNMMTDNNDNLPMFFSWDDTYVVDGDTKGVIANLRNNVFSLTFDQGAQISYDPQLGFDPQDIQSVDNILGNIGIEQFWETVKSPTSFAIILSLVALGFLYISSHVVKFKKK